MKNKLLILLGVFALSANAFADQIHGSVGVSVDVINIKKVSKKIVDDTDTANPVNLTYHKKSPFAYGLLAAVSYSMNEFFFGSEISYKILNKKTSISGSTKSVAPDTVALAAALKDGSAAKLRYKSLFVWSAFVGYNISKEFFVQAGLGWARLNSKFKNYYNPDAAAIRAGAFDKDDFDEAFAELPKVKKNGLAISLGAGFNINPSFSTVLTGSYITGIKAWQIGASARFNF